MLDLAFQPLVNIHTGQTCGVRGIVVSPGGSAPAAPDLRRAAEGDGCLRLLDSLIAERMVRAFARWSLAADAKLFLPLDGRTMAEFAAARWAPLADIVAQAGIPARSVVLEVPEESPRAAVLDGRTPGRPHLAVNVLSTGFGALAAHGQDFVRLSLRREIPDPTRQKSLLAHLAAAAHLLGAKVIAENLQSAADYYLCREAGCDLACGSLICLPQPAAETLAAEYPAVAGLAARDRRQNRTDRRILLDRMEVIAPVPSETPMLEVFELFRSAKDRTFFPVVDETNDPIGLIRECDLKDYTYSQFGRELMSNRSHGHIVRFFVSPCPSASITLPTERILEIFTGSDGADGLILIDAAGKYAGFLSANALLRVINDKNLAFARDQNPLTRLPGNTVIHEFLSECLAHAEGEHLFAYFDFDDFKPFNDAYGFRQGDRAIQAFADILRQQFNDPDDLVGHIGGDDFVAGRRVASDPQDFLARVVRSLETFRQDVVAFYDPEARQSGFITGSDRYGVVRHFPLLRASAAVIRIPKESTERNEPHLDALISALKKKAKASEDRLAWDVLP